MREGLVLHKEMKPIFMLGKKSLLVSIICHFNHFEQIETT